MHKLIILTITAAFIFGCSLPGMQTTETIGLKANLKETVALYENISDFVVIEYEAGRIPEDSFQKLVVVDKELRAAYTLIKGDLSQRMDGLSMALNSLSVALPLIELYVKDENWKTGISVFKNYLEYKKAISGGIQ